MKDRQLTVQLKPMNLENCGEGALAEEFAMCLSEAVDTFEHPERYVVKDQRLKLKIVMTVTLEYDITTGILGVDTNAETKFPKGKQTHTTARLRGGQLLVEPNSQLALYDPAHTD